MLSSSERIADILRKIECFGNEVLLLPRIDRVVFPFMLEPLNN